MLTVVTGHYCDADFARHSELHECLRRNSLNDLVDQVHVLHEEASGSCDLLSYVADTHRPKVRVVEHGRRLDFATAFAYAGEVLPSRRVAVANADIWFDDTVCLLEGLDLTRTMLCLSRWDDQPDGSARHFAHPGSQDAWIFEPPLPAFPDEISFGVSGCDNRVAWEAARAGLSVANPSLSIRAHHLHLSGVRHASSVRVPEPYLEVRSTALPVGRPTG